MRKAIYAGSFDILTYGHLWMIEQGVKLFDELIIAVGVNPSKKTVFSESERLETLMHSYKPANDSGAIKLRSFGDKYLIDFAKEVNANFILRGIRNESDYEYERVMRNINGDLNDKIQTVFLMPPRDIAEVSSSMVKGLIGPAGWEVMIRKYVPEYVVKMLKVKYSA